ncbi:MAG: MG2 domain-containing protein [Terracidiphilus sp.]
MRRHFPWIANLLLVALAVGLLARGGKASSQTMTATYVRNKIVLTIPYHAARAGSGTLTVELLDPEDKVLGSTEQDARTAEGDGEWNLEFAAQQPLAFEDLVWERIRYRYVYRGETNPSFEEIREVSEILRRPVIHILGQSAYLAGGQAAIRILVADQANHVLGGDSSIRIDLVAPDQTARNLFAGRVNRRGTVDAQFRFPAGLTGNYQLHYAAETPIGSAEYTQPVRLEDKVSILLTTEKPIYQPGQTIHVRALALDRADRRAASGPITFEVEDSRGNKVFKKATETDAFGIASTEFALADEVNLGTYHLRALMGDAAAPANSAEIALTVDRYVLPKFKVSIDFPEKDGKPKRDYRPGDRVTGTVRANYFFGEPVASAEVSVKASIMDVAIVDAGSTSGVTDKEGTYHFDLQLPTYFAGRPLDNGMAPVLIEATVKDASDHAETRGEPITVSQSAMLLTAVPEGGTLIPGLENRVFVLASYPDGSPAVATLRVRVTGAADQTVTTDAGGVGVVRVAPRAETVNLVIDAGDAHGNRASATVPLQARNGEDQILLRTNRAVYNAGDRIELDVLSTSPRGSAYIDLVKDGQTILTRDVDIVNGQASLSVDATPEMAGTLEINAYRFGQDAQAIGDHRIVFVEPAGELHIEAVADAQEYKPGSEARIRFRVTDEHGDAVHAALGLQVVDEAVFALAEKQPGFAKVFFYLEQELMKPRFEIHSLSMDDVVEKPPAPDGGERDRDAGALFSTMEMANPNQLDAEFGRALPQAKAEEFRARYRQAFLDQVKGISASLSDLFEQSPRGENLPKAFAEMAQNSPSKLEDAWGTALRLEPAGWSQGSTRYYQVRSAGADREFNTADDLEVTIEARTGMVVGSPGQRPINIKVEHDRGADNGLAEITGSVTDATGAVIPGATVAVRMAGTKDRRRAITNAGGGFTLSGLPPGTYEIEIAAPGFEVGSGQVTLQPRDRAIAASVLNVGATTQTVTVTDGPRFVIMNEAMLAPAPMAEMGVAGGAGFGAGNGFGTGVDGLVEQKALRQDLKGANRATNEFGSAGEAHVRSYFPEALYINPEIVTDRNGEASIVIPIADSITTWRMAMLASTKDGALGTGTSSLKVFQDFFADLDLPVTLTQGDRVTIPVAVYNYAGARGNVELTLEPDDWYTLVNDSGKKSVTVDSGQVGGAQFTLEAKRIGKFKLTLAARMKGAAERRDIVVREIEVVPNGREQDMVFNGRIDGPGEQAVAHSVQFPAESIPDASKILVRIYPGPMSQVLEGMDSLLRMPYGCFEQTSSSTYPNVLALDYMKRTNKLTPEIHAKAEGYIATGYQRLLTFEVPGGGFSWFGQSPANKILTAYGLMEFNDMAKVYDVDPRLIERTRQWLIGLQQPDGSWKPDTSFINEGATNRYNSDLVRITAYIAWALENTGYRGPAIAKAEQFLAAHMDAKMDAYTLAVLANFATEYGQDQGFTKQVMQMLLDARQEKDEQVWWNSEETGVYSTGASAAIETTGLAVQALLKWRQSPAIVRKALAYIAAKKDASGDWGTTQATIMALRALLMASEEGSADVRGAVEVTLNGNVAEKLELTAENNDLFQQFVLSGAEPKEANQVGIRFNGTGSLAYQVVGRYFVPWEAKPAQEALSIDVSYDRTSLAQNDLVTATATIRNNLNKTANMVMVDLGIPPGFELLSEDLQDFEEKTAGAKSGSLEKFNLTATQAILYFNALAPGSRIDLRFRLRAKYPIRAHTFESRVYEYYNPAVSAIARPAEFEVRAR